MHTVRNESAVGKMRQFARMDNLPTEDATQSKDKPRQDKPQQTNKSAHTTDYSDAYGDPQSSVEIDVSQAQAQYATDLRRLVRIASCLV